MCNDKKTIIIILAIAAICLILTVVVLPVYLNHTTTNLMIEKLSTVQQNQSNNVSFYAIYDLFSKHFSTLLTVMGMLVAIFGVAVPLAIAFLQQKSGEIKQKQLNELQKKLEIQEKKSADFFEKQKLEYEMQRSFDDLKNDVYANIHMSNAYVYLRSFDVDHPNDVMLRSCIKSCCDASKYVKDKKNVELVAKMAACSLSQYAEKFSSIFPELTVTDFKDATHWVMESNFSADVKNYIINKINEAIEIIRKK